MKTFNTYFTSPQELKQFIEDVKIVDSSSLLIQVFTSSTDEIFIKNLTNYIDEILPLSSLIGTSTDGEIKDGIVSSFKTVISFSIFEKTKLDTYISGGSENFFKAGTSLASQLNKPDIKAIIAFIDGIQGNGEEFLKGIDFINNDVVVAGGLSGDNANFEKTCVFTKEKFYYDGIVAVGLSSIYLNVYTNYSFNWFKMGMNLKITKAVGNRVYTINDETAYEVYAHYLGYEAAKGLPSTGVEFALIVNRNGINVARAVIGSEYDGSLIFGGNLETGDIVKFGYGDKASILNNIDKNISNIIDISKNNIETIFIYSSMARKKLMFDLIQKETAPYNDLATTSGFFSYGEFYTSGRKDFLNKTITVLALSESDEPTSYIRLQSDIHHLNKEYSSLKTLSHFIKVSSNELEIMNIKLQNDVEDEIEINREKTKQIIEQKQLFETIFNKSKDGILILDEEKFIDCNEAAVNMLNYESKEELLGKYPHELSPEFQPDGMLSSEKAIHHIQRALKNGYYNFEWIHTKSDGEEFWLDIILSDISTDDKIMLFVVWRDIDEKKKVEAKLEELNYSLEKQIAEEVKKNIEIESQRQELILAEEKAKQASIAKSTFLANMSHEIRTPMNAIIGFIDILIKNETSSEKIFKLDIIKESSNTLLEIINDILDFSKIESGKFTIEKTVFETKLPFITINDLFYDKAQEKNITLNIQFDDDISDTAYGDVTRIKQVYSNLLSNAIKFSSNNGNVSVKFSTKDNNLLCSVKDDGIGIKPENISKIFTAFEQEDSSITRRYGGTGLGLAICKRLVDLMGGEMRVESEFNKGSTFSFLIDIFSNIPNMKKEKLVEFVSNKTFNNENILVVEDNKTNQVLLSMLLEELELKHDIAEDGLEAIEAVKNNKYDLILMDENMPNMNGSEATKIIRSLDNTKDIPIIAVTANALKGDKEKFLQSGMNDYISKPIDAKKLEITLKKYISS